VLNVVNGTDDAAVGMSSAQSSDAIPAYFWLKHIPYPNKNSTEYRLDLRDSSAVFGFFYLCLSRSMMDDFRLDHNRYYDFPSGCSEYRPPGMS